jgi:protein O-mannosyl-transferase
MIRRLLLPALLVVATLAAYSNSLSNPLFFDDQINIVDNDTIRALTPLRRTLSGPDESSTAGRPLLNLSFAINYAVGGLAPAGYHAANLLLHVVNGLLLFGIVRYAWAFNRAAQASTRIAPRNKGAAMTGHASAPQSDESPATTIAFASALLWLLHPLHTEIIDYVTQRSEALMALFALITIYTFLRGVQSRQPLPWHVAAVAACGAGMLCKESMIIVPVLVLMLDCALIVPGPAAALRERRWLYAGLFATCLILIPLNVSGPRSNSAGFSSGIDPWTYLLNQAPMVLRYFRLALIPHGLVVDYGLPRAIAFSNVALPFLAVSMIAVAAIAAWRWNRAIGFLATTVFVTLAPTSSIVPIATEVGAERRIYLGLAAIVVLAVAALRAVLKVPRLWTSAIVTLAIVFGTLTYLRNRDYKDPTALWQQVVERYPHGRAHYNLALALEAAGRKSDGANEMLRAAAADFAEAEYALGFDLARQGRHDEAITRLRRYVTRNPMDLNVLRAYNLIGQSALALNRPVEAADAFGETLRRNPDNVDALGGRGDALMRLQRWDDAIPVYQAFLSQRADGGAYFNLGLALMARQRVPEAIAAFERAAQISPRDPAPHAQLATLFASTGNTARAVQELERVLALDPDPQIQNEIREMIQQLRMAR